MDHLHIGLSAGEGAQAKRVVVRRRQRHPFAPARIDKIAWREHGGHAVAPKQVDEFGGRLFSRRFRQNALPYSRAPRHPARVSASTAPMAAAAKCARQAMGKSRAVHRQRLDIGSGQAPADYGGVPIALRLGVRNRLCTRDLAPGQPQQ